MTDVAVLRLKKGEDRRIRTGHVWVFSNEIDVGATPLTDLEPGQPVEVLDSRGSYLASGYANPHSLIAVRILTRQRGEGPDRQLLLKRLQRALLLRERLYSAPFYRLCFAESDGLPGLVVDRYGDVLVVQVTTAGMERLLDDAIAALVELASPTGVLLRADSPARSREGLELYVRTAYGEVPAAVDIVENGVPFRVPLIEGQKTGWFYDHRANRERMCHYVAGGRVLDVFSYIGGWGIQAARAGAAEVLCVDSSTAALESVVANAELGGVADRVNARAGDAFEVLDGLASEGERFDVVILDPPAFIKRKKDVKKGEQAYRRLNRSAFAVLKAGGILVSASCSYHLQRESLLRAVLWGADRAGRTIQVVEEGHQAPDHPFHPAIPETNYLKAFFARALD